MLITNTKSGPSPEDPVGMAIGQWSSLSEFSGAVSVCCNSDRTSPESLLSPGISIKSATRVYRNSGHGTDESLIQFAMTRYAVRLTYNTQVAWKAITLHSNLADTSSRRLKALTKTHKSAFHHVGVANVTCFYECFQPPLAWLIYCRHCGGSLRNMCIHGHVSLTYTHIHTHA